jgi:hypothetical protein
MPMVHEQEALVARAKHLLFPSFLKNFSYSFLEDDGYSSAVSAITRLNIPFSGNECEAF